MKEKSLTICKGWSRGSLGPTWQCRHGSLVDSCNHRRCSRRTSGAGSRGDESGTVDDRVADGDADGALHVAGDSRVGDVDTATCGGTCGNAACKGAGVGVGQVSRIVINTALDQVLVIACRVRVGCCVPARTIQSTRC